MRQYLALAVLMLAAVACSLNPVAIVEPGTQPAIIVTSTISAASSTVVPVGETAHVTRVIDGDTIDVELNGEIVRIRYLGMNTTETNRSEPCSQEGKDANAQLVDGQIVTLVKDLDPDDQYGRQLRYVFVGDVHVNAELVRQGWAEAVMYSPNRAHWDEFITLEQDAANANRGCHGISDIFNDGNYER